MSPEGRGEVMLSIRLLGTPGLERDGRAAPSPRGHKVWALLTYLLLTDRPPSRSHLASLLHPDADDPLAALRWSLAELRRAIGRRDVLRGDPVVASLGDDVTVDVRQLAAGLPDAALLDLSGRLLDGTHLASSPEFDLWLSVERWRLDALVASRLRQAAIALLAAGPAGRGGRVSAPSRRTQSARRGQSRAADPHLGDEPRWVALLPWPQTLNSELALNRGDLVGAEIGLEEAWVMRELLARSLLHRHRLGDGHALESARLLARQVENPVVDRLLQGGRRA